MMRSTLWFQLLMAFISSNSSVNDSPTAPLPISFEEAMGELETIVHGMDDDKVPLESLLAHYARGRQLVAFCQERIDDAQQRVELITASPAGGAAQLTPLDPAHDSSTSSLTNRSANPAARSAAAAPPDDDIRFS